MKMDFERWIQRIYLRDGDPLVVLNSSGADENYKELVKLVTIIGIIRQASF